MAEDVHITWGDRGPGDEIFLVLPLAEDSWGVHCRAEVVAVEGDGLGGGIVNLDILVVIAPFRVLGDEQVETNRWCRCRCRCWWL